MTKAFARVGLALGSLLLLSACLLTPGTFDSTLDIRADRSFTFTYKGEVIVTDPSDLTKGLKDEDSDDTQPAAEDEDATMQNIAWQPDRAAPEPLAPPSKAEQEPDAQTAQSAKPDGDFSDLEKASKQRKIDAIVAALRNEKGFNSVSYIGDNKYMIDYAITGTLTHSFVFPFNVDAEFVFPFIVIELRGDDRVRVKAPGYSNGGSAKKSAGGMGGDTQDMGKFLDGHFTLTTDASLISQNQEDGPTTVAGKQQVRWAITPLTSEAPMAVVRFGAKK